MEYDLLDLKKRYATADRSEHWRFLDLPEHPAQSPSSDNEGITKRPSNAWPTRHGWNRPRPSPAALSTKGIGRAPLAKMAGQLTVGPSPWDLHSAKSCGGLVAGTKAKRACPPPAERMPNERSGACHDRGQRSTVRSPAARGVAPRGPRRFTWSCGPAAVKDCARPTWLRRRSRSLRPSPVGPAEPQSRQRVARSCAPPRPVPGGDRQRFFSDRGYGHLPVQHEHGGGHRPWAIAKSYPPGGRGAFEGAAPTDPGAARDAAQRHSTAQPDPVREAGDDLARDARLLHASEDRAGSDRLHRGPGLRSTRRGAPAISAPGRMNDLTWHTAGSHVERL